MREDLEMILDENNAAGSGVIHRQRYDKPYDVLGDDVFFPVNHTQVRRLIGALLTNLDAMALPDRARRAAKTLLVQSAWNWWSDACENAATGSAGCLAPVVMNYRSTPADVVRSEPPSNRWGWKSEDEYLASPRVTDDGRRPSRAEMRD